ncbi:antibiotic biosynthesis monooxygenase [Jiella sp. M17.18]|uniref:antibiotic biosynthesis monooxygenase family protein n=1 Tax=Jiella sp. M17.18 TaxID=3234247 RepID=UPI0034DFB054
MPLIRSQAGIVTQINVFTVPEGGQQALIDHLCEAARLCRKDVPGWLSASLHRSHDGTRVANYAQCRDMSSWHAVMETLRGHGFIDGNRRFGTAHPGLYDVVATFER